MTLRELLDLLRELLPNAYLFPASQWALSSNNAHAIGLVIQPGPRGGVDIARMVGTYPASVANFWGHTGIYVRRNSRISRAIGYDPNRFEMFSPHGFRVAEGRISTPGYFYNEDVMFRSPDVICVEFAVPLQVANNVLIQFPAPGAAVGRGMLEHYVTQGGSALRGRFDPDRMGNCIDFIQQLLGRSGLQVILDDGITRQPVDSQQGHMTGAALRGQLRLRDTGNGLVRNGARLRMAPVYQVTRRIGGALRVMGTAAVLGSLGWDAVQLSHSPAFVRQHGGSFPAWLAEVLVNLIPAVIERIAQVLGTTWSLDLGLSPLPERWVQHTLFFFVLIVDHLIETVPRGRWTSLLQVIDGILVYGATIAWLAWISSGSWESALLSFAMLVGIALR